MNIWYVMMNKVQEKDIREFVWNFHFSDKLANTRILITGGTGLIGSMLARCLLALNAGIHIFLPVRNMNKAERMYSEEDNEHLHFIACDLMDYLSSMNEHFDYIIHCASPTDGGYMCSYPVETFMLAIDTTQHILAYALKHALKGIVYVSSLEYYGQNFDDRIITEEILGYINPLSPRSSYPMGKRAAEYLCFAYANEFGIPVKVARLTQTFGAGISPTDNRVFAQFARSVIQGHDIVLHTKGDSAKPYCYTTDCVSAILTILFEGVNGEAYNVANQETYISIRAMAEFFRDCFNPQIKVIVEEHPEMGYAPVTKLHLSTEKLLALGWMPKYGLKDMITNLIESLRIDNGLC